MDSFSDERVHRYNAEGLAGLVDRPLPGRTPMLSTEQMRELAVIVETGPDPDRDGTVRWRRIDLCDVVERRLGCGWQSGRWARSSAGSASRSCRRGRVTRGAIRKPRSHMKNIAELVCTALPDEAKDKPLEVWFQMLWSRAPWIVTASLMRNARKLVMP